MLDDFHAAHSNQRSSLACEHFGLWLRAAEIGASEFAVFFAREYEVRRGV